MIVPGHPGAGGASSLGETRSPMLPPKGPPPSGASLMMAAATMADLGKAEKGKPSAQKA